MKEEDARGKSPHKLDSISQMLPHPPTHMCVCPHNAARVPRPRNAFILFRQHQHQIVTQEHPGKTNPEISKIIGEMWRTLPAEEKEYWVQLGDEEKKSHLERFPDYRYQPRRSSKRNGASSFSSNTPMNESGVCAVCKGLLPGSSAAAAAEKAAQQQQQHHQHQHQHQHQQQNSPVSAPGTPVKKPSDVENLGGLSVHHYQVQLPPLQPPPANYQRSQSHPGYAQYQQQPLYQYSPNGYPMHALAPPPPPSQHHKSSAPNLSIYNPPINMHDHQRHQSAPEAYISIGPQQQQQPPPPPPPHHHHHHQQSQPQQQHHHQHQHQHQHQPQHQPQQPHQHHPQQQHEAHPHSQHLAHPQSHAHQPLQQIPQSHPAHQQQFQHMGHSSHIQGSHPAPMRVMSAPGTSSANSSISSTVSGRSGSQGSTFSRTSVGSMTSEYSFHSAPSSISVPKDAGAPAVTTSVTVAAVNTSTTSAPPVQTSETSAPPKSPVDQTARKQSVVSPTQAWHNDTYQSPNRPATSAPQISSSTANGSPAASGNTTSIPAIGPASHSQSSPFLRPHVPFASGLTVLSEEEHQYKKRRTSSYHDPLALRPQAVSRGERYQSAIALAALKGNQQQVHGGSHLTSLYSSVSSDQAGNYPEGSASPVSSVAEGLSIRDKADALAMIGEPAGKFYRSNSSDSNSSDSGSSRGRFISIEGEDHEMVKKIADMLQDKLPDPVFSSGLYHSDIHTSAPANFHNSMAVTYWKLGYLHQMVSDIELDKNKYAILAGYTVSLVDEFANNAHPSGSTGDHLDEMAYRQSWMTHVSSLKGLPSPDYMVYLQPEGGLSQGELTVAELKGSQKLLLIGGTKDMADKIVEKIMKTVMEGSTS